MAFYQQSGFIKTRGLRPSAPKAARAAAEVFSKLARATCYAEPGLADHWPTIAGAEMAALARPGRILGSGKGRTLEIIVRNGAAAAQAQMRTDDLLKAVNRYLGPGSVSRITIRQTSGQARSEDKDEADGALSAALSSFRNAVSARNPQK